MASFVKPTAKIHSTFKAVMCLLGEKEDWESIRKLLRPS